VFCPIYSTRFLLEVHISVTVSVLLRTTFSTARVYSSKVLKGQVTNHAVLTTGVWVGSRTFSNFASLPFQADLSFAFNVELVLKNPLYILHLNLSRLCPDATFPKPSTSATLIAEMSKNVLMNEYKALAKEKWVEIELGDEEDLYNWTIALIVINPDSLYYGGYFKAKMSFPTDYPYKPPDFRFLRPLWHPNIYEDGKLCISILHAPGEDMMSGESAGERWSPAQRVESVLISILSLLDDAEISSPANVDAGKMLRDEPEKYKERVKKDVELSKKDVPEGFIMPTHETTKPAVEKFNDDDFWADSDVEDEDTFGGSDSDAEMTMDDSDEEDQEDEDDDDEDDEVQDGADTEKEMESEMSDDETA